MEQQATECGNCGEPFDEDEVRVRVAVDDERDELWHARCVQP